MIRHAITVRPFRPDDALACAKVLQKGWKLAFPGSKRKVTLAVFAQETEGETLLVAERCNRVIGFASVYPPENFLHHLYVEPSKHRKGAGSLLLRAAQAMLTGPLQLKTQRANTRARAFYAKHSYRVTEEGIDQNGPWVRLEAQGVPSPPVGREGPH